MLRHERPGHRHRLGLHAERGRDDRRRRVRQRPGRCGGDHLGPAAGPLVSTIAPQLVTVTATDTAGVAAQATFRVIRDVLLSNAPISGRPRQKTTWRFVGFPPGTAIYGHYRFHGRTIRNYRFGVPTGPCGALVVRARRVPIRASRLRSGTWTLQLDQRRHYRRTGARRVIRFRIFRTLL